MVVLDLAAVTLRSHHAADAIDEAAVELERRGGCLLCINADDEVRAQLGTCTHAVVVARGGFASVEPTALTAVPCAVAGTVTYRGAVSDAPVLRAPA